jgi:hypothetical protein
MRDFSFITDCNFRMTDGDFDLEDDNDDDIIRFCLADERSTMLFKNGYCLFNITHSGLDFYWYVGTYNSDSIGVDTDKERDNRLKIIGVDII